MNSNYSSKDIERREFQAEEEDYEKAPKQETNVFKSFIAERCGKAMRKDMRANAGITLLKRSYHCWTQLD